MNELKNDRLDAMILLSAYILAEKNEADLMSVDASDVEILPSVNRRIIRLINKEWRKREYGAIYMAAKRVLAVILIVCTVAFTFAMSIEAVRNAFWSTIIKWYDDYLTITHVIEELPPEFIEEKKEPSIVPDDWIRQVKLDSDFMYYIQYLFDGEDVLSYKQKILDDSEKWFDSDNSSLLWMNVQGHDGYLITMNEQGTSYLVWNDNCYSYTIEFDNSEVNIELVINIANSIH